MVAHPGSDHCTRTRPARPQIVDAIRWDEEAGLRRDAVRSQVIDALEAQEIEMRLEKQKR
jgi:hypothetical protein